MATSSSRPMNRPAILTAASRPTSPVTTLSDRSTSAFIFSRSIFQRSASFSRSSGTWEMSSSKASASPSKCRCTSCEKTADWIRMRSASSRLLHSASRASRMLEKVVSVGWMIGSGTPMALQTSSRVSLRAWTNCASLGDRSSFWNSRFWNFITSQRWKPRLPFSVRCRSFETSIAPSSSSPAAPSRGVTIPAPVSPFSKIMALADMALSDSTAEAMAGRSGARLRYSSSGLGERNQTTCSRSKRTG